MENDLIIRSEAMRTYQNICYGISCNECKAKETDGTCRLEKWVRTLPPAQPECDREFIKLTVGNSNGRPYYSIIYLEVDDNGVGHDFEGYSSYSLDVISDYLKKYFMPSAHSETCEGCKHLGKWENEVEYGYPSPCTRCKRRVEDRYE